MVESSTRAHKRFVDLIGYVNFFLFEQRKRQLKDWWIRQQKRTKGTRPLFSSTRS